MRILIIVAMMLSPSIALADAPTETELEKAVAEMEMPRFEARLKARAAVARLIAQTAERYGFDLEAASKAQSNAAPIIVAERTR